MKLDLFKIRLRLKPILIVFLMLTLLSSNVYAQKNVATINMNDVSIVDVIKELEKQTKYTFLYKNDQVQNTKKVNINVNKRPIITILDLLMSKTGLSYTIDDNVVIITNPDPAATEAGLRRVSGTVVDEEDIPLIGVSIKLEGSSTHVISDTDGKFSLPVPVGGRPFLQLSYIGMEPKTVIVSDNKSQKIVMETSSIRLSDVVIEAGYGMAQKRADMVGSAYQVNAEQLKNLPPARIDNMLEGIVPGLSIEVNSDSDTGVRSRLSTRIRGRGSLSAGSEPIWIVDGIRIYTGGNTNAITGLETSISPLTFLNPNDIESFTVLKDASAVSLYGADGSNGVILVTTKKGQEGKTKINAGMRFGVSQINENLKFKLLNADQYMTLAKESYKNRYGNLDFFPYQDLPNNNYSTTDTDWYDVFFGRGNSQEFNLSMSGSNKTFSNYISASYYRNEGTVKGNTQERFSVRANIDVKLHRKLTFSLNTSLSYNVNNLFTPGSDYYTFLPIVSVYNDDGSYRMYSDYIEEVSGVATTKSRRFFNSVAEREENDNKQRTIANLTSASLVYDVIDGLKATGQFGIDYSSSNENIYNAMSNWSGRNTLDGNKEVGYAYRNTPSRLYWNGVLRLNYNKEIGKHSIGALLATEAMAKEYRTVSSSGNTFANDYIKEVTYAVNKSGSSGQTINHVASFIGQLSYSYDKRYYLTVNTRRDGNSDFGEDVQWAQFASIGGSWNIHSESFFDYPAINILKLKASYGSSGNSRLGDVQAKGVYNYGDNYNGVPAATMGSIRNRKLSWETAYITNIGLRVKFLDRFDVEVEAYNKTTDNLINSTGISLITGATAIDANISKMRNQGIEVNIESQNIQTKDFTWSTSFNISHNRNKILDLYVARLGSTNKVWAVGQDVNTWRLVRWAGVNPRNGEPLWYDLRGNITNVYDINNAVSYKTSTPDFEGGIRNNFIYKNFSLGMITTYSVGGYGFSSFSGTQTSDGNNLQTQNESINQLDRWQKPGDIALSPKPLWNINTNSGRNSTRFLFNKTHLRLKNIALGYTLPESILKRSGISSGSVSFIVDNIAIWTPYGKSGRNTYAQSMSGYPAEITYSLGLNLAF